MSAPDEFHVGRAWSGHAIEDDCPCPKAPCGLVLGVFNVDCDQHNPTKTLRQGHRASECPA